MASVCIHYINLRSPIGLGSSSVLIRPSAKSHVFRTRACRSKHVLVTTIKSSKNCLIRVSMIEYKHSRIERHMLTVPDLAEAYLRVILAVYECLLYVRRSLPEGQCVSVGGCSRRRRRARCRRAAAACRRPRAGCRRRRARPWAPRCRCRTSSSTNTSRRSTTRRSV